MSIIHRPRGVRIARAVVIGLTLCENINVPHNALKADQPRSEAADSFFADTVCNRHAPAQAIQRAKRC
jgi:hypothetical protein